MVLILIIYLTRSFASRWHPRRTFVACSMATTVRKNDPSLTVKNHPVRCSPASNCHVATKMKTSARIWVVVWLGGIQNYILPTAKPRKASPLCLGGLESATLPVQEPFKLKNGIYTFESHEIHPKDKELLRDLPTGIGSVGPADPPVHSFACKGPCPPSASPTKGTRKLQQQQQQQQIMVVPYLLVF